MDSTAFRPIGFLGSGCYSLVYAVTSAGVQDYGKFYALKRFFVRHPRVLLSAMREHNILKRLAAEGNASPFLPVLHYSLTIKRSPVLVLNKARSISLNDIVIERGPLNETQARTYISEILCGLSYLHALNIVHMELMPTNILLSHSGHILITDFDRSLDLSQQGVHAEPGDFNVNRYYAAPEIARKLVISDKADVWSVGVLMAYLLGKSIRRETVSIAEQERNTRKGLWNISGFKRLSTSLQQFFRVCLTIPYVLRPSITEVQRLNFFEGVKWEDVQALQLEPPFAPHELDAIAVTIYRSYNPHDPLIINTLFDSEAPEIFYNTFRFITDCYGNVSLAKLPPVRVRFDKIGYTPRMVEDCLNQFNFIHPTLLPAEAN